MPGLQPDIDYVRAYQGLYGVTLRLATEYASLPPGNGGGGLNGNSQATAYGQALRDVCADNFGDTNCIGKCAILQDVATMVDAMDNLYPGSLYGALLQINDTASASTWAQNEIAKLTALVTLFGWTYIGPNAPSPFTVTDYVLDVGETDFISQNFDSTGILLDCQTNGISITITGGTNYANIGSLDFSVQNSLVNPVVTLPNKTEGAEFTVDINENGLTISGVSGAGDFPITFPVLIQCTDIIGEITAINLTGGFAVVMGA
jgi:hypothetical protein